MKANAVRIDCQILIEGDRGLTVEFDQPKNSAGEDRVTALAALLEAEMLTGVQAVLPNERFLTVIYDPMKLTYGRLSRKLSSLTRTLASKEPPAERQDKEEKPHEDH
ncbi:MAG: carboxyltransferase domain-containing protein [Eubacteriales bacterium]